MSPARVRARGPAARPTPPLGVQPRSSLGRGLAAATWESNQTGERARRPCGGLFVMVGAAANTAWLADVVALDPRGFVLTGPAADRAAPHETSTPGIYAVGDVRAGSSKRVAAAVGEGLVVISQAWHHIHA